MKPKFTLAAMALITLFSTLLLPGCLYGFVELFAFANGDGPSVLMESANGEFYGTTAYGGASGNGSVYKLTHSGILTTLYSFTNGSDGARPYAGVVQGGDGNFYGTTFLGGRTIGLETTDGTVFKMTPSGILTTLASFPYTNASFVSGGGGDVYPCGNLMRANDGNFYGTTSGIYNLPADQAAAFYFGPGSVFKVTSSGVLTTLVSFDGTNGACPEAALLQGRDGTFYGTTCGGGDGQIGTVFKMTPSGALTTLISFNGSNGTVLPSVFGHPSAALVQGIDGNLYGTTGGGGANDRGTVFRMTPAGEMTTLYSFTNGTDGSEPNGVIQAGDGNFYGTTLSGGAGGGGTVFKMTSSGILTTLVSFNGTNGSGPWVPLVQGTDGNFYGTCAGGGSQGGGNIFRIDSLTNSPPMTATTMSNQIIVSWPEDYPAFTLQTATRLNPPVNWLDATDSPVLLNGQFTVTNSLSSTMFYRLRY